MFSTISSIAQGLQSASSTFTASSARSIDYRAGRLLLAINVGHPRVAGHFLHALGDAQDATWVDFLKARELAAVPDELREPHGRLLAQLRKLPIDCPAELGRYQHSAHRVACYSFDLRSPLAGSGIVQTA